jgi:phosphate transport system permease protein
MLSHARATPQFWNRMARVTITAGGVSIVLAVLAILVFIAREAAPLFARATASSVAVAAPSLDRAPVLAAWVDDDRTLALEVTAHEVVIFRTQNGEVVRREPLSFGDSTVATSAILVPQTGQLVLGAADGRAALAQIGFETAWRSGQRVTTPEIRWRAVAQLDSLGRAVQQVGADRDQDGRIAMCGILADGAARYVLLDESGAMAARVALDSSLTGRQPTSLVVSLHTGLLALGTADGTLWFWKLDDPARPELEDHLRAGTGAVTALAMLLGDQTLVVGTERGEVSTWLRVRYVRAENGSDRTVEVDGQPLAPGEQRTVLDRDYSRRFAHVEGLRFTTAGHPWTHIRELERHTSAVRVIAASPRGRSFATADAGGEIRLRHSTTHRTLATVTAETAASQPGPGDAAALRGLAFAPRGGSLVACADGAPGLRLWSLSAPHSEASPEAFFGTVWYEGYVEPKHVWQSTGGSDEFEPKLGLVPLLVGTLKGTLYALLFSVPVAVLAALYVSQLASPGLRNAIKPAIELMAAMPSVVVGFLAALWLAPLLESHLTAALSLVLAVPVALIGAVAAWYLLPLRWRQRAHPGVELAFLVPFLLGAVWAATALGRPFEMHLFGGDVRQWLFDNFGVTYDQRNCIVVGIALGFAIIPIIFTISEDAMSAVPRSLTSAALALGASRWQSALHVILPAASPGIFAAIMLGLGRAIGETMIVLMATGNTPILDLSPFNGMRTMSAAIAVEVPEAPFGGTLYRVLFLVGSLLFAFTFLLNSAADGIGRRLRKRYGQF